MTEEKKAKPQLHQSHLQLLYRCGYKFSRIVLNGEREPSTTPLIVGTATHATIAKNLTNKIEKGSLLPREAVQDLSHDDFIKTWHESQLVLNEEEQSQGLDKTRDILQDQTIQLVTEHHYSVANKINPKVIERKWVLEAVGYPWDLAGMIDVDEGVGIRDTKTMEVDRGETNVHRSDQYTIYALAKYMIDGKVPEYVAEDALIKPTKTQPARAISRISTRTKEDFKIVFERFDQAIKVIKAGLFLPANPSGFDSPCQYCGFARSGACKYFNTKRIFANRKPPEIKPRQSIEAAETIVKNLESLL